MEIKFGFPAGRRGFTLLEVGLALGMAAVALAGVARAEFEASTQARAISAADAMVEMQPVAVQYVEKHVGQLLQQTVPGGPPVAIPIARISVDSRPPAGLPGLPGIQEDGMIPDRYIDTNTFHQHHVLLFRQTASHQGEAMLVEVDGDEIRDADLGRMARHIGSSGGFMSRVRLAGVAKNDIQGSQGTWRESADDWVSGGSTPTVGRAVLMLDGGVFGPVAAAVSGYRSTVAATGASPTGGAAPPGGETAANTPPQLDEAPFTMSDPSPAPSNPTMVAADPPPSNPGAQPDSDNSMAELTKNIEAIKQAQEKYQRIQQWTCDPYGECGPIQ